MAQGSGVEALGHRSQVSAVRVPDAMLLHGVRHDGGVADAEPTAGGGGQQHILQHLEPVLRVPHPAPRATQNSSPEIGFYGFMGLGCKPHEKRLNHTTLKNLCL